MEQHVVIIIPALNEDRTIGSVISRIPKVIPGISLITVLVIDDGSTDVTAAVARNASATVISHPLTKGVGAAFHTGIKNALELGADYIVNIDADGQFNPEDIPQLLSPIQQGKVEFVTATRFAMKKHMPQMPAIKLWGNKWMVRIINFITSKKFTDVSCGFRAYSREAALRLTLFGHFTYTQESFIDLAFKGVTMAEVSLQVRGQREFGNSRVASNLWRYGAKSFSIIFRAARDYRPFYFIGVPGVIILVIGIIMGVFVTWHYIATGHTSPYRSLVTGSGMLMIIGFLLLFISLLADMIHRSRMAVEEVLYLTRKATYKK